MDRCTVCRSQFIILSALILIQPVPSRLNNSEIFDQFKCTLLINDTIFYFTVGEQTLENFLSYFLPVQRGVQCTAVTEQTNERTNGILH